MKGFKTEWKVRKPQITNLIGGRGRGGQGRNKNLEIKWQKYRNPLEQKFYILTAEKQEVTDIKK